MKCNEPNFEIKIVQKKIASEIKAADVGLLTNAIIVSYPFVSKEPLAPSERNWSNNRVSLFSREKTRAER